MDIKTDGVRIDADRDQLSRAIVESLHSWPDMHRRIFVEVHYRGRNAAQVADAVGLRVIDVNRILERCERRLHQALRDFRSGQKDGAYNGCRYSVPVPHPCSCLH